MQLKNHLYTIVETDKQGNLQQKEAAGLQQKCQEVLSSRSNTSFRLRLNPEHFIYQAHFPGEPITPGVCIVQMGTELLEDLLCEGLQKKVKLEICKVKNVKFLSVISPNESTVITYLMKKVEMSEDGSEVKAQMVVTSGDEAKAKISLVLSVKC